jgi:hypothetical protein
MMQYTTPSDLEILIIMNNGPSNKDTENFIVYINHFLTAKYKISPNSPRKRSSASQTRALMTSNAADKNYKNISMRYSALKKSSTPKSSNFLSKKPKKKHKEKNHSKKKGKRKLKMNDSVYKLFIYFVVLCSHSLDQCLTFYQYSDNLMEVCF